MSNDETMSYFEKDKSYGIDADFISKINLTVPLPDLEKVSKQIKEIAGDIDQLENKIEAILSYQYNEYVNAFSNFMDSVRKKIRDKLDLMEQKEKEYQKKNDIQIIKTERDFFRKEAVRLNGLCKDMSQKIEEIGFNMKLLNGDLTTMTNKWKESENINKQLLVELDNNIQIMKTVEKENSDLKEKAMKINNPGINQNDGNSINNAAASFDQMQIQKYNYMVEKLKSDLKKECNRNNKTLAELNKLIKEKNLLEIIFNDCVEEVRKDIFSRKLKETIESNVINKKYIGQSTSSVENDKIPFVSDIKYDKFLSGDKKKIMEKFILKDDITAVIQELLFRTTKSELENNSMFQGINILNENRIALDNEPLSQSHTKNTFMKGRFNFSCSLGKKTHGNFGIGMKFKNYKINN